MVLVMKIAEKLTKPTMASVMTAARALNTVTAFLDWVSPVSWHSNPSVYRVL